MRSLIETLRRELASLPKSKRPSAVIYRGTAKTGVRLGSKKPLEGAKRDKRQRELEAAFGVSEQESHMDTDVPLVERAYQLQAAMHRLRARHGRRPGKIGHPSPVITPLPKLG